MTTFQALADEIGDELTFRELPGAVEVLQNEVYVYPGMLELASLPLKINFPFFVSERSRGRVEALLVGFDGLRATYAINLRV